MRKCFSTIIMFGLISFLIPTASDAQLTGQLEAAGNDDELLDGTVIYLEHVAGNFKPPQENPVMNQINLTFVPHVLPIIKGTTVDFLNSDEVLHNVFSPDKCANSFNLGTYPKNQLRSQTFTELGCQSVVLCNVHPEMEAYVLVLQNPYYTTADKEGKFTIENVPPGKYVLKVWNEELAAPDKKVSVEDDGSTYVFIKLHRKT